MSLVSVIMPCYNMEAYIENSIRSVFAQTYTDWELIVVDDASKDRSCEIVQRLMAEDPRVRLVSLEQNGGITNARNTALSHAKGRYIAFLDSDDQWLPEKLERHITYMKEQNVAFTYSAFYRMTEDGKVVSVRNVPEQLDYRALLRKNHIGCLTVVLDREQLKPFSMPKIRHEDYATWLSILKENEITAHGLSTPLARYMVRGGSVSSNKWKSMTWVYHIYRTQEGLSMGKAACYIARWFVDSIIAK